MDENPVSREIIGSAIEVHRELGPGLLESVYQECLAIEFRLKGIEFRREVQVPLTYKGCELRDPLRMDFLVANCVVVETKSVQSLLPVHDAQLLTYLRLTNHRLGLLINFNAATLRRGIKRIVNNL